jgi:hypothetical protein
MYRRNRISGDRVEIKKNFIQQQGYPVHGRYLVQQISPGAINRYREYGLKMYQAISG